MAYLRWVALVGALALHHPVSAASFDCAAASSAREKVICGDPRLSDLDARLGEVYRERRALLSAQGVAQLRRSQQSWLRFIGIVCPLKPAEGGYSPARCLDREYSERLAQLEAVGEKIGPFVFSRVDHFSAKASAPDDTTGWREGSSYSHVSLPQIDSPVGEWAANWNKAVARNLPEESAADEEGATDIEIGYRIGYASHQIISLRWSESTYGHGAAHGNGRSVVENTVLRPTPHLLNAAELFGIGDSWIPKLQTVFAQALRKQGWKPATEDAMDEVSAIVIQPERWLLTNDGIEVEFNSYEGGCYACTPQPVTVPWAAIKPLLAPGGWRFP